MWSIIAILFLTFVQQFHPKSHIQEHITELHVMHKICGSNHSTFQTTVGELKVEDVGLFNSILILLPKAAISPAEGEGAATFSSFGASGCYVMRQFK